MNGLFAKSIVAVILAALYKIGGFLYLLIMVPILFVALRVTLEISDKLRLHYWHMSVRSFGRTSLGSDTSAGRSAQAVPN